MTIIVIVCRNTANISSAMRNGGKHTTPCDWVTGVRLADFCQCAVISRRIVARVSGMVTKSQIESLTLGTLTLDTPLLPLLFDGWNPNQKLIKSSVMSQYRDTHKQWRKTYNVHLNRLLCVIHIQGLPLNLREIHSVGSSFHAKESSVLTQFQILLN